MEILLNKMYTGSFTTTAIDIGHEIINFFKTDKGENYVYALRLAIGRVCGKFPVSL